jgi:hypothetical protein
MRSAAPGQREERKLGVTKRPSSPNATCGKSALGLCKYHCASASLRTRAGTHGAVSHGGTEPCVTAGAVAQRTEFELATCTCVNEGNT